MGCGASKHDVRTNSVNRFRVNTVGQIEDERESRLIEIGNDGPSISAGDRAVQVSDSSSDKMPDTNIPINQKRRVEAGQYTATSGVAADAGV
jgi:hypothetical protein